MVVVLLLTTMAMMMLFHSTARYFLLIWLKHFVARDLIGIVWIFIEFQIFVTWRGRTKSRGANDDHAQKKHLFKYLKTSVVHTGWTCNETVRYIISSGDNNGGGRSNVDDGGGGS